MPSSYATNPSLMQPAPEPLQLALLHAAPLVWRHEGRLAPLDHQSLSLDFKAEVRAMWDMLGRTRKQVSVRFGEASSAATTFRGLPSPPVAFRGLPRPSAPGRDLP